MTLVVDLRPWRRFLTRRLPLVVLGMVALAGYAFIVKPDRDLAAEYPGLGLESYGPLEHEAALRRTAELYAASLGKTVFAMGETGLLPTPPGAAPRAYGLAFLDDWAGGALWTSLIWEAGRWRRAPASVLEPWFSPAPLIDVGDRMFFLPENQSNRFKIKAALDRIADEQARRRSEVRIAREPGK